MFSLSEPLLLSSVNFNSNSVMGGGGNSMGWNNSILSHFNILHLCYESQFSAEYIRARDYNEDKILMNAFGLAFLTICQMIKDSKLN